MHYNIIILEHDIDPWWWCQWVTVVVVFAVVSVTCRGVLATVKHTVHAPSQCAWAPPMLMAVHPLHFLYAKVRAGTETVISSRQSP